jgi:RNA polymerase sigma-70 factor (ECF subfamily)
MIAGAMASLAGSRRTESPGRWRKGADMSEATRTATADSDDDTLIARFAGGDQSAARILTERHIGRVLALATRMLRDTAEAEDVAQETMLRAWRNAAKWEPGKAKFSTWLHKVALNLCYDRLRKRKSSSLDEVAEPIDDRASAQQGMEADERLTLLKDAMEALPERQRAAIQMRHFEERGNDETAEILGVTVEAVESLLSRGRRALRDRLAGQRALLLEE